MDNDRKVKSTIKTLVICSIISIIKFLLICVLFIYLLYIFGPESTIESIKQSAIEKFGSAELIDDSSLIAASGSFAKLIISNNLEDEYSSSMYFFEFLYDYRGLMVLVQIFGLLLNILGIVFAKTKNKIMVMVCGLIKILSVSLISGFVYLFSASKLKLPVNAVDNSNINYNNNVDDSYINPYFQSNRNANNGNDNVENSNNYNNENNNYESYDSNNASNNNFDYNHIILDKEGNEKYGKVPEKCISHVVIGIIVLLIGLATIFYIVGIFFIVIGIIAITSKNDGSVLVKIDKRIKIGDPYEKVRYLLKNFEVMMNRDIYGRFVLTYEFKYKLNKDFEKKIYYFKDGILVDKGEAYHRTTTG